MMKKSDKIFKKLFHSFSSFDELITKIRLMILNSEN